MTGFFSLARRILKYDKESIKLTNLDRQADFFAGLFLFSKKIKHTITKFFLKKTVLKILGTDKKTK